MVDEARDVSLASCVDDPGVVQSEHVTTAVASAFHFINFFSLVAHDVANQLPHVFYHGLRALKPPLQNDKVMGPKRLPTRCVCTAERSLLTSPSERGTRVKRPRPWILEGKTAKRVCASHFYKALLDLVLSPEGAGLCLQLCDARRKLTPTKNRSLPPSLCFAKGGRAWKAASV